jgi:hypothetical protein
METGTALGCAVDLPTVPQLSDGQARPAIPSVRLFQPPDAPRPASPSSKSDAETLPFIVIKTCR